MHAPLEVILVKMVLIYCASQTKILMSSIIVSGYEFEALELRSLFYVHVYLLINVLST
jgi:hypothetical protein